MPAAALVRKKKPISNAKSNAAHAPARTSTPPSQRTSFSRVPLSSIRIQMFNNISSPQDSAEREARTVAKKIVSMTLPENSTAYVRTGSEGAFRQVNKEGEVRELWTKQQAPSIARYPSSGAFTRTEEPSSASTDMAANIQISAAGGLPLPLGVRRFMEPRFRADFSKVKIQTGDKAAGLNRQLSAQAFAKGDDIFFGKDKYQPDTLEGKELIAHELAHTIQQGAAIQRSEELSVTERSPARVQRLFGITSPLNYIAEKASLIPGFRMLTIILGVNPVNMNRVERSAANILRALVEFIPGGALITQALDNHGVFDKVGNWVELQIKTLGLAGSSIKQAVTDFISGLKWSDIGDLGGVWERAKRIFTEPIARIVSFAKGLAADIIKFIKDAILMPLAKLAEGTRGYDLLKAVLGKDPVTGDTVPRTAETLIGGFMKLIGEEEVWSNIKKANAIPRAWAWFQGAMKTMTGFVQQIPTLFIAAFKSLEITDIVLVPRAFAKVASVFGSFIGNFISWAGNAVWNLLQIIFEVVAPKAIPYLKKAGGAFKSILKNPIGFVGNLVKAGKLGFETFAKNIGMHLKNSLIEWLTGSLPGVYIPKALEFGEIVKFVLSVLGLTWQNIRQKLVKIVGETAMKAMETGFDIVVTLVREGPAAAWGKIKEQLGNLKDMVMGAIMDYVVETVVKKAVAKVVSLLIPGAAFIQAIITIYDTIMVFIDKLQKIIQVVTAFMDSIMDIAAGAISGAAKKVESTLAGLLTLAISFLAGFARLGRIADKVMEIINDKVRAPIDKALDFVVNWIVTMAKKLFGAVKAGAAKVTGLLFPKKKLVLADTTHTMELEEDNQAYEIVVRSNRMRIGEIIAKARKDNLAAAQIGALENKYKEWRALPKPKDPESQKKAYAERSKKYEEMYQLSEPLLQQIFAGDVITKIEWGGLDILGRATWVRANPLTKKGAKGSAPREPIPGHDTGLKYDGEYISYIRTHLLHHDLGGPGRSINLTPTSNSLNQKIFNRVEEKALKEVGKGKILIYTANVEYKDNPDAAELKKVKPAKKQNLLKFSAHKITYNVTYKDTHKLVVPRLDEYNWK